MSDVERAGPADGEAPVNPYSLLEAVNASAETVQRGWLIFIAIMAYLTVAVAGVTHKDLLLSTDIPLPLLGVGIELTRFFLFAPIVLVLVHIGIVGQLVMLAAKALQLDAALRMVEATDRRTHPLRLELGNFFFVQAIAGPERSRIVNGLLHGLTWLTLVILPVLLLLYIQVTFLPYHAIAITWAHRLGVLADVVLLLLLGVFMMRPEPSLGQALARALGDHPLVGVMTVGALAGLSVFSLLLATVPGERLDRLARSMLPSPVQAALLGAADAMAPGLQEHTPSAGDGRLLGLFERNLRLTDADLVIDRNVTPGETSLNLRRRDLRYARLDRTDLHQADLTGARLDGASFVGADLRGARLSCADLSLLLLSDDRARAGCTSAFRANFARARLAGADLAGIDLGRAVLDEADLAGASLAYAILAGASAYGARLGGADLTGGIAAQGTNFATASLHGADLTGARLQGADFTGASLQGATLDFAGLEGAGLGNASLDGASLVETGLALADLGRASLAGANLRQAGVWQAKAPDAKAVAEADLADIRPARPSREAIARIAQGLQRMADAPLVVRLRAALAPLLAEATATPAAVKPGMEAAWVRLAAASRLELPDPPRLTTGSVAGPSAGTPSDASPGDANGATAAPSPPSALNRTLRGKVRLTQLLGDLACKSRFADGAVATGLARRAAGPRFEGDAAALLERLRQPQCPASRTIAAAALRRLAVKVEEQAAN